MSTIINKDNFIDAKYDVFKKFHSQLGVVSVGEEGDFRCMTIGWGMMGNVWGHPGSAITVYVHPSRYTFEYMQEKEYFVVSFFPEQYHDDVFQLGRTSGRDGDKVAQTRLTPKTIEHGVGFEEAELTFVCRKISAQQFKLENCPQHMVDGIYSKMEPHYMYIGFIEDAFGVID